jgi:hypothetical protein
MKSHDVDEAFILIEVRLLDVREEIHFYQFIALIILRLFNLFMRLILREMYSVQVCLYLLLLFLDLQ